MKMNGTESAQRLSERKLKEIQEQMQRKILNKSVDVIFDTVSIPVNIDPTLKMSFPGESNSVNNVDTVDTVASAARSSANSSISGDFS